MKKNNGKITISIIAGVIIGYIGGVSIGLPGIDTTLLNGDVSKSTKTATEHPENINDENEPTCVFNEKTPNAKTTIKDKREKEPTCVFNEKNTGQKTKSEE